jgi:Ca2+-binding EF-hand superfamily protein
VQQASSGGYYPPPGPQQQQQFAPYPQQSTWGASPPHAGGHYPQQQQLQQQQYQQQQQQQMYYQQQQPTAPPPRRQSFGPPPALIVSSSHPRPWELYALSQEEYDQIVAIFMTFDEDDSGELDRGELEKLARWLNFAQQPGEIDRMFRDMDTDHSGSLTLEEFCTWHKYHKPDPQSLYGMKQSDYNVVLMQFRSYDSNHDGALSVGEFQRLCQQLRFYPTPQEAAQVFAQIDLDRNGTVDLHEFLMFRSAQQQQQQQQHQGRYQQPQPQPYGYPQPQQQQQGQPPQQGQPYGSGGYYLNPRV